MDLEQIEMRTEIKRPLTRREREMRDNLVNTPDRLKIIAWRMNITELGARQVARHVYMKTGATGRIELMQQEIERLRANGMDASGMEKAS